MSTATTPTAWPEGYPAPPVADPPPLPPSLHDAFLAAQSRRGDIAAPGAPIADGQRNATLASFAGSMRRPGMAEDEILDVILAINGKRCVPPLDEDEVRTIVRSVAGYAPAETPEALSTPVEALPAGAAWQSLDLAQFLREPPPAPDWLFEGFVEHGELVWLSGPGKVGKSMVVLFLAGAALSGAPRFLNVTLDRLDWVLYVDGENSAASVRRRVHLAGVSIEVADRIDYQAVRGVDLGAREHLDHLASLVNRPGRGLVILDSLIALHRADEDKASEVRAFVTGIRAVAESAGVTVIGLAHENRGGNLRGSLDWRNAADTVLEIRKDAAGWRTLKIGDRRNGAEDLSPRVFRFVNRDRRLLIEATETDHLGKSHGLAETIRTLRVGEPGLSKAETARRVGYERDHWTFKNAYAKAISAD